jgi:hypothetical protein
MTLKTAATLMGYRERGDLPRRRIKDAVEILSRSIRDGTISCERQSRQRYVFDRRAFPVEAHPSITPPN